MTDYIINELYQLSAHYQGIFVTAGLLFALYLIYVLIKIEGGHKV